MKLAPLPIIICAAAGVATYYFTSWILPVKGAASWETLGIAIGWAGSILVGLLALVVAYRMFTGSIDLTKLVSEPNGDASMSRFQFLVFTFVIALCLLFITVKSGNFPTTIPPEILGLLGISAGSYVVSKSLQNNLTTSQALPSVTLTPAAISAAVGHSVTVTANANGSGTFTYQWQRQAPGTTDWQDIAGATNATYVVVPVASADNKAQYRCKVSNANGDSFGGPAILTIIEDRG